MRKHLKNNNGATAITAVLAIGAVGLLLVKTAVWQGVRELDDAFSSVRGDSAGLLAESCVHDALRMIQAGEGITAGENTIGFTDGNCGYETIFENGIFHIEAYGQTKGYRRDISVLASYDALSGIKIISYE